MTASPVPTRTDDFLGGRLRLTQPAHGYRAGADAVMLAAACAAAPGQSVLELGCGAGAALLCLGVRVPGLTLAGIEHDPLAANLARANADAAGLAAHIVTGDLSRLPPGVAATSTDHVIANPPFFATGTRAPDAYRAGARHEETPLADWIDTGLRRLRPRGWLTVIHRAERLGDLLDALSGRAGDVAILPVAPRAGAAAGRVIVAARKGARGPLRLLAPFVMHANARHLHDGEDLTPEAQAVLRGGAALDLKPPERR